MDSTHAIAPAGMSYVNAFHAVWGNIQPLSLFASMPHLLEVEEKEVSTPKRVAGLFLKTLQQEEGEVRLDMTIVGGRVVQTDFGGFPAIRPYEISSSFDLREAHGEVRVSDVRMEKKPSAVRAQSAQRALDEYDKIPSAERFDAGDRYNFTDLVELFHLLNWQELASQQSVYFSGVHQVGVLRGWNAHM